MTTRTWVGFPLCLLLLAGPALAQETQPESAASTRLTPLKLQLVLSRYSGEKKLSSLPYLLWVTANDRSVTNLRMGVEVPISTVAGGGGNYSYRSVGTTIDCTAASTDGGFKLSLTLSDSSIHFDPKDGGQSAIRAAEAPAFRTFTSKFNIILRDGQTAQYTSATDPVSGEVMKVDVTLNVLK